MSSDVDATHVEERIREALNEIAERVTFTGELAPDAQRTEHRGPVRTLAVAGIAAVCVVAVAVGVGVAVQRGSRRSPGVGRGPSSTSAAPSSTTPPTTPTTTADPVATAALEAWANFPAAADPRPLVLLEGPVNAPDGGFTDPDIRVADAQKEAFDAGAITTPSSLPAGPPNAGGYPIIGAADALARIRAAGSGTASTVLTTTGIQLGTGSFLTDRGAARLPAWLVSFSGVQNPAVVLAVDPVSLFAAPDPAAVALIGAGTTPGSRTLTLTFTGAAAGTGPCTADYSAHVTESAVAVAVDIETTTHGSPGGSVACVAIGYSRHVTITLPEPLGARVLVDEKTKAPIEVAP